MIYYLLIINFISFCFFGIDKYKSIKHRYRISERTLLFISFIGGCFGAFFSMIIFHHKTRKKKFVILVPLLILFWVIGLVFLYDVS